MWALPVLYILAMVAIAFWPVPVDSSAGPQLAWTLNWLHDHGVPEFVNYEFVEFSANVLFFMPLGFFLAVGLRRPITACVLGTAASGLIESGQHLFLPNRFATLTDVVANSLGCALGVGMWLVVWRIQSNRKARQAPIS